MAKIGDNFNYISKDERFNLLEIINEVISKLEFRTKEMAETQITVWKRLISKGFLTKREAYVLFGFFRKIKNYVK